MTVTPSTVTSMYDLATAYLDAIVAAMDSTDTGPPDRAFVAPGQPTFETQCDQAAVWIPNLTEGATSPTQPSEITGQRSRYGRVNLVALTGYAIRCASVSENTQIYEPLTDTTLNSQARAVYQDGWSVWNWITQLIRTQQLFGGTCGIQHFDRGSPYQTEGGLAGWQFQLRVQLDGYKPDLSGWPPPLPIGGA
jgi:hypothetical protein